ncbi:MAG TPA: T9SS type A sorting domain-containing protein, partial [Saprospiraceae bacterium]|nr:T9SS type A sorting domain-containing protein [Saprospiraceae bacterium]
GDPLDFGFTCQEVSSVKTPAKPGFVHSASYGLGDVFVNYTIPKDVMVMVELVSMSGQPIVLERPMMKKAGSYSIPLQQARRRLMPGAYVYRIRVTGADYTGKLIIN